MQHGRSTEPNVVKLANSGKLHSGLHTPLDQERLLKTVELIEYHSHPLHLSLLSGMQDPFTL